MGPRLSKNHYLTPLRKWNLETQDFCLMMKVSELFCLTSQHYRISIPLLLLELLTMISLTLTSLTLPTLNLALANTLFLQITAWIFSGVDISLSAIPVMLSLQKLWSKIFIMHVHLPTTQIILILGLLMIVDIICLQI